MAFKAAVAVAVLAGADAARKNVKRHESRLTCGAAGNSLLQTAGPNMSIVNGDDAKECAWKWQVGLKSSASGRPWCGGMLISPEWVLTAAHCLTGEPQNGVYVVAGEWNIQTRSGNEQTIRSAQWINHPKYSSFSNDFDIGLVKLETPMVMNSCVGTVCLPTEDVEPGTTCVISGWGTLSSGGSTPNTLQQAEVQVLSNDQCRGWSTGYLPWQIKDSMLCAQGKAASGDIIDACQGDSGGPLVCQSGGTWSVYGATSWGRGCAGARYPGIWSRVTESLDWIEETAQ